MSEALMELTRKGGFEISLRQADNIIDFYSVVLKADETIEQWMSLIHKKNAYVKVDGKWTLGGKPIDKDNPFVDYVLGGTRKGRGVEAQFDLDDVVDGVKKSVTELADDGPLVLNPKFDEILKEAANKVRSAYNKVDPLSFSGGLNSRFTVYQWMLITTGTAAIIYAIHKYWSSKRTKKVSDFYEDIQRKDNSQAIADALALHSAEFDYEKEEADGMLENIVELFNPDPDRSEGRIVLATLYDKYIFVRPVDIIANKVVDEWEKYVSTTSLQAAEGLDRNKVKNFGFKLRNMLLDLKCGQLVNDVVGDRLPKKIGKGEEEARPKGQHFKWDKYFIDHSVPPTTFQLFNIITILLIQNIGYYLVHKLFHMSKLYKFHKFHHKFDKILIPSLGNAVSITEFTLAYMLPFVMGAYITHPSELSMIIPLFLVAILNMSIHCQELNKFKYPSFIVSPKNHFIHHQERNKHFAAPILNIDKIINSSQK